MTSRYRLWVDDYGIGAQFLAGTSDAFFFFFFWYRFQTSSGSRLASWPMSTSCSFPGSEAAGFETDHSSSFNTVVENGWSYTSPIFLHAMVHN
jgi:hypothetical protein